MWVDLNDPLPEVGVVDPLGTMEKIMVLVGDPAEMAATGRKDTAAREEEGVGAPNITRAGAGRVLLRG